MIHKILEHYHIKPTKIVTIDIGLINKTYKIEAGQENFILQKMNSRYGHENIEDIRNISNYINTREQIVPELIRTQSGNYYIERNGEYWRIFEFIDGNIYKKLPNDLIANEVGFILGKFHRLTGNLEYKFQTKNPPIHDSERFFKIYTNTIRKDDLPKDVHKIHESIIDMPKLFLDNKLRKLIIHGDPKISNFIFSKDGKRAIKIIDLDECNRDNVIVELGDAFRSWCGGDEADPNNNFDLDKFSAAINGYLRGVDGLITNKERRLIIQGIKLITLELTSRFLTDYVEDNYFGWDNSKYASRKEHNLARAQGQFTLYKDIVQKEKEIGRIIEKAIA